ncbi:MAG TPA: radical SAM protein [Deltaproteobacteria bacterium]|nr:radical SAM protein [Deltaproteobacteria bacterium]
MTGCTLCPRRCAINRSKTLGPCGVGEDLKVGAIVIHRGEEPPLVTGAGSGAVFFSGCPLKCSYCQNRQISHEADGRDISPEELADYMMLLERKGCSNINLVSPTHLAPGIRRALALAAGHGLDLPVVLNSSGYESIEGLESWVGSADIFLMDLKYGDNETGKTLSRVPDYWDRAREAIEYVWREYGPLQIDPQGRGMKGLIVRHLVLPGMRSNPFAVLEFLADLSPEIPLSIMSQYNPCFYRGALSEMSRPLSLGEYEVVVERAIDLGFGTVFTQDMDSPSTYVPDFSLETPFGDGLRIF